jgi:hypothetical protein
MHTFDLFVGGRKKGAPKGASPLIPHKEGEKVANYAPYGPRVGAALKGSPTIGGENATQVRHQYSRALQLGKAGEYLSVPTAGLGLEANFSVSIKFKLVSPATKQPQLLWGTGKDGAGIACYVLNGVLYAGTWSDAGSAATALIGKVSPDKWQHVALVFDRKAKQLCSYYRPERQTLKKVHAVKVIPPVNSELAVGNAPLKIIHKGTETSLTPTAGMIDDFHVFARILSESDAGMLGHTFALDPAQVAAVKEAAAKRASKKAEEAKKAAPKQPKKEWKEGKARSNL